MDQNKLRKAESCCGTSVKDQIKAKWDKLTDNDCNESEKHMDGLSRRIQKAYGRTKEVADREVSEFRKSIASEPMASMKM